MAARLSELAARFGAELRGQDGVIERVATLQHAEPGALAFLANPKYRRHLATTRATAVVLAPEDAADCPVTALVCANPYAVYARIAASLFPEPAFEPGIDARASVAPGARIAPDAYIGPCAVIATDTEIGAGVYVGPGCVVEAGASVGPGSRLVANVTICRGVRIGARALVHPGAVIGADGFGLARDGQVWIKVPQLGSVRIGDDVEIGANTTIDRGALEDTLIEDGVKLDNQIQIAHNVRVGAHTAIAGCTAVAGSSTIGRRCMIAGGVGIAGHLEICDDVVVTAMTLVTHSITRPGVYSGSLPMDEARKWRRNSARYRQLDELARRLRLLEEKLDAKG